MPSKDMAKTWQGHANQSRKRIPTHSRGTLYVQEDMLVDDAGGACLRRGQARWLDDKSAWAFCMNCAWNELDALPRDVAVADDSVPRDVAVAVARAELEDWAVDFAFALLFFFARAARGASAEERARERNARARAT